MSRCTVSIVCIAGLLGLPLLPGPAAWPDRARALAARPFFITCDQQARSFILCMPHGGARTAQTSTPRHASRTLLMLVHTAHLVDVFWPGKLHGLEPLQRQAGCHLLDGSWWAALSEQVIQQALVTCCEACKDIHSSASAVPCWQGHLVQVLLRLLTTVGDEQVVRICSHQVQVPEHSHQRPWHHAISRVAKTSDALKCSRVTNT